MWWTKITVSRTLSPFRCEQGCCRFSGLQRSNCNLEFYCITAKLWISALPSSFLKCVPLLILPIVVDCVMPIIVSLLLCIGEGFLNVLFGPTSRAQSLARIKSLNVAHPLIFLKLCCQATATSQLKSFHNFMFQIMVRNTPRFLQSLFSPSRCDSYSNSFFCSHAFLLPVALLFFAVSLF